MAHFDKPSDTAPTTSLTGSFLFWIICFVMPLKRHVTTFARLFAHIIEMDFNLFMWFDFRESSFQHFKNKFTMSPTISNGEICHIYDKLKRSVTTNLTPIIPSTLIVKEITRKTLAHQLHIVFFPTTNQIIWNPYMTEQIPNHSKSIQYYVKTYHRFYTWHILETNSKIMFTSDEL